MEEKDNSLGKNYLDDNEESNFKDKKINVEVSNKERRAVKHRDEKETIDSSNIDCDIKKDNPMERDPDNIKTESENINAGIGMNSKELNQKVDDLTVQVEFKKPTIIIGPRRGKRKKISSIIKVEQEIEQNDKESNAPLDKVMSSAKHTMSSNEKAITGSLKSHKTIALKYQEPCWGTKPDDEYKLEVLKSGVIIQTIDLTEKSYHVVGRLPNCDISLAHPTISRFHAVIQYRGIEDESNSKGLYIYDLGSTHGTYWNGNRVPPNAYVRLYDSHIIKFGCSARKYILQALHETKEEESELSFTELREKRMLEIQEREKIKAAQRSKMIEEERLKREDVEENEGIDWGMGEDADEETDLTENPYAATNNEELYLNDPKKSLRGWFEREGYDLQYHTEEKGFAQFLCWVDLPIESIAGHTVRAEALVKGKKKECVVQCALEACKILDRYGLLRQATHEGRKRKVKNWEEDDYYSSDEDNFLDRTGSIEKKRKRRMRLAGKLEPQEEDTYNSLMEKHTTVVKKITDLVECMRRSQKFENESSKSVEDADEDTLDAFMSSLNATVLSKADKRKMKIELQDLRQEEAKLIKLLNPLRPTNLPPLIIHIVPLNEVKKSIEIFDNDQSMDQRENRQISNDETTIGPHNNISQSKQNDYNSLNEEESRRENNEGDNNLKTSTEEISNNLDSRREETEIPKVISVREVVDNLLSVENLSFGKTTLYEDTTNVSSSDRSSTKKSKKVTKKEVKEIYDKDVYNENYSTWVPPQNQTGDGKTSLNDKYGY
ncbi:kanadaptin-like [Vespa mandarinia]|uniref:kanadaptin-like n=1 Tax=Vespa mandarinia TaxID=7446 RepID=UPI001616D283|nr:kanadaptin-like [Vespa mandarinia]